MFGKWSFFSSLSDICLSLAFIRGSCWDKTWLTLRRRLRQQARENRLQSQVKLPDQPAVKLHSLADHLLVRNLQARKLQQEKLQRFMTSMDREELSWWSWPAVQKCTCNCGSIEYYMWLCTMTTAGKGGCWPSFSKRASEGWCATYMLLGTITERGL